VHRNRPDGLDDAEKNLPLDLQTLTEEAVRLYGSKLSNTNVVDDVIDFMPFRMLADAEDTGQGIHFIGNRHGAGHRAGRQIVTGLPRRLALMSITPRAPACCRSAT
jgi:hypothetical protein